MEIENSKSKKFSNSLYGKDNNNYKHGLSSSKLYQIYFRMKRCCYNNNYVDYIYYGGRGIRICSEWLDKMNGFMNFYNWAMASGYKEGLSIDRIDNNGNYEPSNCRWATHKEQMNNRRYNYRITYNGENHNLEEWAKILNMNLHTLKTRIYIYKWSDEKALTTPIQIHRGINDESKR